MLSSTTTRVNLSSKTGSAKSRTRESHHLPNHKRPCYRQVSQYTSPSDPGNHSPESSQTGSAESYWQCSPSLAAEKKPTFSTISEWTEPQSHSLLQQECTQRHLKKARIALRDYIIHLKQPAKAWKCVFLDPSKHAAWPIGAQRAFNRVPNTALWLRRGWGMSKLQTVQTPETNGRLVNERARKQCQSASCISVVLLFGIFNLHRNGPVIFLATIFVPLEEEQKPAQHQGVPRRAGT